jgi:hypothetical protein
MTQDLSLLLRDLLQAGVELILVGGLAAVAQGAPVTTFDVDIVHRRSADNVDRLLGVVNRLGAYVREPANRRLPPTREGLLGPGHNLLVTSLGPLDCLGAIERGLDFEKLLPRTTELVFGGHLLRVLQLSALLELKEEWTDEESKLRAAILRRTLLSHTNGE